MSSKHGLSNSAGRSRAALKRPRADAKAGGGARADARTSGPPRLDATNLAGLTSLMNVQNLRPNADLEGAERNIMGREGPAPTKKVSELDPVQLYTKELNELADELGINFLDGDGPGGAASDSASDRAGASSRQEAAAVPAPARPRNPLKGNTIDDLIGDLDLGSDSGEGSGGSGESSQDYDDAEDYTDYASGGGADGYSGTPEEDSGDDDEDTDSGDSVISNLEKDLGIDLAAARRRSDQRRQVHKIPGADAAHRGRSRLSDLTEEQERRRHINSVMGDMRQETRTSFGVEHERVQDVKASKLEQIGQLRMTLEEEGVDCSGVGAPSMSSPIDEIDSVLAILKLKNDRNRYSSLAEEVILGLAEGIETVFDGTREMPVVGWKPDYTGYHNTVNVKLHRMRFETSQVVGNVIEKYNIGPTTRIIMELLPSFFLYPRQQHKQRGSPGLHADFGERRQTSRVADARGAYSAIRRSDVPDAIGSVSNI